jgi:hypothetical protein
MFFAELKMLSPYERVHCRGFLTMFKGVINKWYENLELIVRSGMVCPLDGKLTISFFA